MHLISKHFYFYAMIFLVCTILSPFSISHAEETAVAEPPPILQDIVNERDKKPSMKSVTWNFPKKEVESESDAEDKKKKASEKDGDEESSSEKEGSSSDDESLTAEQKLWNKYRDLADGKGKKTVEDKDKTGEKSSADDEKSDEKEVATEEEPKKKSGLQGILENYKNAQKDKGRMNSRSFGNPDR